MLYISRRIGSELFGVVDTDDDTEEVVSTAKLEDCVKRNGLVIEGVERFQDFRHRARILPQQFADTLSRQQIKARMVYGVDITVYNGAITSILWDELKAPATLRLSDFGSELGDCILYCHENYSTPKLTLVFDDGIKSLSYMSLRVETWHPTSMVKPTGVVIDVSEVSDLNMVRLIRTSAGGSDMRAIESGMIEVVDRRGR